MKKKEHGNLGRRKENPLGYDSALYFQCYKKDRERWKKQAKNAGFGNMGEYLRHVLDSA